MKANSRQVNGVTVIDLSGRIILGEPTSALQEMFRDMVGRGQKKILLNMADVHSIDSSGLSALASGYSSVTSQQGQLKLVNLTKRVHDLLQLTKLLTVFEVFDDEAAAVKSFQ